MKSFLSLFILLLSFVCLTCGSGQTKEEVPKPIAPSQELKTFADSYWNQKCSACHGTNGIPDPNLNPGPRKFGTFGMKMGFFFGGNKMRAGIFRTIRDGKNQAMPSFSKELKEEQIWALVEKIERLPN
ncbi:cytochrome c [Leptospira langatensis]|uniref:Cytochrome c n=1 Tax=Leptospira langatensis TaxID=2484983 RepID=A0A5F1ZSZ6_9LEPT|nr:cytochrome c [Leptospira langatensis]TGK02914.1 cytochrome c [Leptospira langatensis]TGL41669.1 cytochrome c [Leptospira langatensis]